MEEKTAEEVAQIFKAAGDSVTLINTAKTSDETDDEYKDKIKRNVEHLEIIKAYKKLDETTSIWGSEDFTAIDKAIVDGKKVYSEFLIMTIEELQQRLQQLNLERSQLEISFNQLTGAMLEVERQIVEEQKKLEPEKKEEKANAT